MNGLDGPEEDLEREKDLEQELIRRALFTEYYKVTDSNKMKKFCLTWEANLRPSDLQPTTLPSELERPG